MHMLYIHVGGRIHVYWPDCMLMDIYLYKYAWRCLFFTQPDKFTRVLATVGLIQL